MAALSNRPHLCNFLYRDTRLIPGSAAARTRLDRCVRNAAQVRHPSPSEPAPAGLGVGLLDTAGGVG